MNLKEAARILNGGEYREETSLELTKQLKESGIVALYGASDDLAEFSGALYDETGAPGTIYLTRDKILSEEEAIEYAKYGRPYSTILAKWNDARSEFCWSYETDIEHEIFHIYEDGDPYCRGIVFYLKSLEKTY